MMFALAVYLVVIYYFMQTSRYPYAWYVAGFVPLVIWSDTYMDIDNTFHFGIFRLLGTSAGVLIYSIVSVVLWPQTAGDQLHRLGSEFLDRSRQLFGLYRRSMREDAPAADRSALRLQLDRLLPQIQATLQAAYQDTAVVKAQRHAWALVPGALRTLTDALELWQVSIEDCRRLDPERALVGLETALQTLDQRFERIEALWAAGQLAGIAPASTLPRQGQQQAIERPPRWDPERFATALIPALAFIIGYLLWIYPTALLGGVRGLLDAMAETDRAIAEIKWEQWAVARF